MKQWKLHILKETSKDELTTLIEEAKDLDEVKTLLGNRHLSHYGKKKCPITLDQFEHAFTDHNRYGSFNACPQCHADNRTVGERLQQINEERKQQ